MIVIKKKKKENLIPVFLFCLMLAALGVKGFHWVATDTANALKAGSWPYTDGIIMDAGVRTSYGSMFTGVQHSPRIRYRYIVEGEEYIGDTISFPPRRYASLPRAQEALRPYVEGSVRQVYYNPRDPGVSTLQRGRVSFFFIAVMGTVSVLLLALGLSVFRFTVGYIRK